MGHQKKLTYIDELGGCGLLVISPSFKVLAKGNCKNGKRKIMYSVATNFDACLGYI